MFWEQFIEGIGAGLNGLKSCLSWNGKFDMTVKEDNKDMIWNLGYDIVWE